MILGFQRWSDLIPIIVIVISVVSVGVELPIVIGLFHLDSARSSEHGGSLGVEIAVVTGAAAHDDSLRRHHAACSALKFSYFKFDLQLFI